MRTRPGRRIVTGSLLVALAAAPLAACGGDERTPESFCRTYNEQKKEYLDRYSAIDTNATDGAAVLTNLILGIQSLGDVKIILDKLEEAAPDDIRPDVKAVSESWDNMLNTMGDEAENAFNPTGLAGAMIKGMLMAVESNGSWTRLGQYVTDHCGG